MSLLRPLASYPGAARSLKSPVGSCLCGNPTLSSHRERLHFIAENTSHIALARFA